MVGSKITRRDFLRLLGITAATVIFGEGCISHDENSQSPLLNATTNLEIEYDISFYDIPEKVKGIRIYPDGRSLDAILKDGGYEIVGQRVYFLGEGGGPSDYVAEDIRDAYEDIINVSVELAKKENASAIYIKGPENVLGYGSNAVSAFPGGVGGLARVTVYFLKTK